MKFSRSFKTLVLVLMLGLAPVMAVSAQGLPPTPDPATAPTGVLATFELRRLVSPYAEVWFLRFQLDPGGSLPLGEQMGQTVFYVEAGTLTIEAQGVVIDADLQVVDATRSEPISIGASGSLMLTTGSEASLSNTADEPTTFLMLTMFSPMDEGQGGEQGDEPVGLSQAGISVGSAQFVPGPATLTMERVVVEPGESIQNITLPEGMQNMGPGWGGIDLGVIEAGSAEILFENQTVQNLIWPSLNSDQMSGPEQVMLSGSVNVEAGESYAGFNSVMTFTNTGDGPLVILRVIVAPHMGPGQ